MGFALCEMQVQSSAIDAHGAIPTRHAQDGDDVSPPLQWRDPPAGTRAFAVICHDPDAPLVKPGSYGFTHWVLYGLPGSVTHLEEGTQRGTPGANDAGGRGWVGPAPPPGHGRHHYYFWVLALDRELDLEPGLDLETFLERAEPHVLGMNRMVGTYIRG